MRRLAKAVALLMVCGAVAGCEHHFFNAQGTISNDDGKLGRWSVLPEGCERDPGDQKPFGQSTTVLTFLWQDPRVRERNPKTIPYAPTRLEISGTGTDLTANLETTKTSGTMLDRDTCSTFDLTTAEGKPLIAGARPTLGGTLRMDCRAQGSHVMADLKFSGCEF